MKLTYYLACLRCFMMSHREFDNGSLPIVEGHNSALGDDACQEEKHRVAQELERVPHVLHGFARVDEGPDIGSENESARDAAQHPGHARFRLAQEKADVGRDHGDGNLNRFVGVAVLLARQVNPDDGAKPDKGTK